MVLTLSNLLLSCGDNTITNKESTSADSAWRITEEVKSSSSDGIGITYIAKSKTSTVDLEEEKNLDSQIDLDKDNANK